MTDFAAIDFETVNEQRSSVCSVGVVIVRGGGWHNFSGFSSPVINWWNACNKPGTVSTGFGTLVTKAVWAPGTDSVTLTLEFDRELAGREVALVACFRDGPEEFKVRAAKKPLTITLR